MSEFNRLFNSFFKTKTKNFYIIILFQLIAALVITFFSYFNVANWQITRNTKNNGAGFVPEWLLIFGILAFLLISFILIYTPIHSERYNRSPTWRLAAISDGQFYLANVLSTFVVFIYFIVLEIIPAIVLAFLAYFIDKPFQQGFHELLQAIHPSFDTRVFFIVIGTIMLAILSCFFLYFIISFLNFASQAIIDFVPANVNGAITKILHIFIICILIWFFFEINSIFIGNVLFSLITKMDFRIDYYSELPFAVLANTISDAILLFLNIFLINHFFEASEQNK